jgi:RNA polymerase sigma-70 factor (ECF subfamily)
MARYAGGDVAAFQELYDRYEGRLYGFCLRYLGDRDAAADAFQEVFERLIDARNKYEPRSRFASWLFTIARRVCLDRLREDRRNESLEAGAERPVLEVDDTGHPDDDLARRDEVQRLIRALPVKQREVLLLSKYYGFSYGEIAEMLGSSEVAVKQRAYRALQALRAHPSLEME